MCPNTPPSAPHAHLASPFLPPPPLHRSSGTPPHTDVKREDGEAAGGGGGERKGRKEGVATSTQQPNDRTPETPLSPPPADRPPTAFRFRLRLFGQPPPSFSRFLRFSLGGKGGGTETKQKRKNQMGKGKAKGGVERKTGKRKPPSFPHLGVGLTLRQKQFKRQFQSCGI